MEQRCGSVASVSVIHVGASFQQRPHQGLAGVPALHGSRQRRRARAVELVRRRLGAQQLHHDRGVPQ